MYPKLTSAFASVRSCREIYTPSGAAHEYADLALNIYTGCTHGCRYCYAPATMRKSKAAFFSFPFPRKNILTLVQRDAQWLAKWVSGWVKLRDAMSDGTITPQKIITIKEQAIKIIKEFNQVLDAAGMKGVS
jgi:DNA repair photolyase